MAKKQILTNTEIEKDIIGALKKPPEMSKESYKKISFRISRNSLTAFLVCLLLGRKA
jgi:hypothetical protein